MKQGHHKIKRCPIFSWTRGNTGVSDKMVAVLQPWSSQPIKKCFKRSKSIKLCVSSRNTQTLTFSGKTYISGMEQEFPFPHKTFWTHIHFSQFLSSERNPLRCSNFQDTHSLLQANSLHSQSVHSLGRREPEHSEKCLCYITALCDYLSKIGPSPRFELILFTNWATTTVVVIKHLL